MDEALALLAQLLALPNAADTKASIIAIAQAAGIDTTSFQLGDPTERFLEIAAQAMGAWGAVPTMAVRGMFLELATDPGDPGDLSADQTPRAGFLSALGAGWFGTRRRGQTYATGFVTITNTGSSPTSPIPPYGITFERNSVGTDGGTVTYRNTPSGQYTYAGGNLPPLAAGASLTIPVQADIIGTYSTAAANTITTVQTQSYGTLSCANPSGVVGADREAPAPYVQRSKLNADKLSPGGPAKGYQYAANTAIDGTPLANYVTGAPVSITTTQVLPSSTTGVVTGYYAGAGGAVQATDVSSANANITGIPLGLITDPIGILPDTVSIGPQGTDPGTGGPGFASCSNLTIAVNYSLRIKGSKVPGGASPGTYSVPWSGSTRYVIGATVSNGTSPARQYRCTTAGTSAASGGPTGTGGSIGDGGGSLVWAYVQDLATNSGTSSATTPSGTLGVFAVIANDLTTWLPGLGPGGVDQDASGNGVVYVDDILEQVQGAVTGLYGGALTLPGGGMGATIVASVGNCPTQGTTTGTLVVVAG